MTDPSRTATATRPDDRPYSPGLEGVLAGETELSHVDGERGRLTYRGYRIGDLVERGSYSAVANLLWTGEWDPNHHLPTAPVPDAVMTALRALPSNAKPMDALRTAVSAWGATESLAYPPTPEQARALTAFSPSALAAFARLRSGKEPIEPDPSLDLVPGFLYQLTGEKPDAGTARALDAYFIVGAEHGLNASTFTARVITSTGAEVAAAFSGAIGAMSGPLHGGAPSRVLGMISDVEESGDAAGYVKDLLDKGERLMGFGHRVYRAEDPRARVLRRTAKELAAPRYEVAEALEKAALKELRERRPDRVLETNVEFWAAIVLDFAEVPPHMFTSMFTCARTGGWAAHILEQKRTGRLIRPSAIYTGPASRPADAVSGWRTDWA
jgi:citrate synthase